MTPPADRDNKMPPEIDIEIAVAAGDWPDGLEALCHTAISAATARLPDLLEGTCTLSVLFTNDGAQKVLNARWRQIDRTTNVLSFPGHDDERPLSGFLGDISLAYETVQGEADEQALAFDDHLTHLLVHGFLHILGYDHLEPVEAGEMEKLETAILAGLGIADPYADSIPVTP